MTSWLRARTLAVRAVDRTPPVRRAVARLWAQIARRRGADPLLVDAALADAAQRSILHTGQTLQWATALTGRAPTPRHFRPETAFDAPIREHVRRTVTTDRRRDPHLTRQLWGLTEPDDLPALLVDVERELPALLRASRATPPKLASAAQQLEVIDRLSRALETNGHRLFPISGTLLGIVRDGAPMATDYDIDLGLLPGDGRVADVAAAIDALRGFDAEVSPGRVVVTTGGGIKIDVFLHLERDGRFWHQTDIHEWWNTPFGLERRHVEGCELWVPENGERYLEENYGPGWVVPSMFYDMSFDTPNRRYLRTPAAVVYLVRRALEASRTGDRWVYEASLRALEEEFGMTWNDAGVRA